jgi:DNA-binding transcriptional ArsR family regulator
MMDRRPSPALLPILRSRQQGEILALLLGDPELELSLTEIATRLGVPHPSVYREIQRAEQADLVTSRKVGNTRLVRADTGSPYYAGPADVLTRAFGVPGVLAEALRDIGGHRRARPRRPGPGPPLRRPQRRRTRLGRPVQATICDRAWLEPGTGAFHDTITSRPLLRLPLPDD